MCLLPCQPNGPDLDAFKGSSLSLVARALSIGPTVERRLWRRDGAHYMRGSHPWRSPGVKICSRATFILSVPPRIASFRSLTVAPPYGADGVLDARCCLSRGRGPVPRVARRLPRRGSAQLGAGRGGTPPGARGRPSLAGAGWGAAVQRPRARHALPRTGRHARASGGIMRDNVRRVRRRGPRAARAARGCGQQHTRTAECTTSAACPKSLRTRRAAPQGRTRRATRVSCGLTPPVCHRRRASSGPTAVGREWVAAQGHQGYVRPVRRPGKSAVPPSGVCLVQGRARGGGVEEGGVDRLPSVEIRTLSMCAPGCQRRGKTPV